MAAKIRAFLAAGIFGTDVSGLNSATGSPRRSMTITPPLAASRTNSDVRMCSSRMEVFRSCYIVASAPLAAFRLSLVMERLLSRSGSNREF